MKYLIKSKAVDAVIAGPPEQAITVAENVALPSLKMLAEGEHNGRFVGGAIAGQRAWAVIADFASHEEANKWVMSLPFWNVELVEIVPLVSFESHAAEISRLVQGMKSMLRK